MTVTKNVSRRRDMTPKSEAECELCEARIIAMKAALKAEE